MTQAQADKKIAQILKLAYKATMARDKLEETLERVQKQRNWIKACELTGMDPRGRAGDWMC